MQSPARNLIRNKNLCGGALMFLIGLGAVFKGRSYHIGTLSQMGAGFFPVAIGVILALVGIAIAINTSFMTPQTVERLPAEWRGWFCISLSIVAFVVLGKYCGLVVATFAIVFISALGDRSNKIKDAVLLALSMVAVCVGVFWWALQMHFPLFG